MPIAPSRTSRGGSSVTSTIEEGSTATDRTVSGRIAVSATPIALARGAFDSCCTATSTDVDGGTPRRLALVENSGPPQAVTSRRETGSTAGRIASLSSTVTAAGAPSAATTIKVSGPGHRAAASSSAAAFHTAADDRAVAASFTKHMRGRGLW